MYGTASGNRLVLLVGRYGRPGMSMARMAEDKTARSRGAERYGRLGDESFVAKAPNATELFAWKGKVLVSLTTYGNTAPLGDLETAVSEVLAKL